VSINLKKLYFKLEQIYIYEDFFFGGSEAIEAVIFYWVGKT
jgi:hypothetical protein